MSDEQQGLPAGEPTPVDLPSLLDQQAAAPESATPPPVKIPELNEQPEEEVFGGDVKSNPNIHIDASAPILEEISEEQVRQLADIGTLFAPNHSAEELTKLYEHTVKVITAHQRHRHALVKSGENTPYFAINVGDNQTLYITALERDVMANIGYYRRIQRQGHGEHLFTEGDTWINMPKVGDAILAIGKNNFANSKDARMKFRGAMGLSGEYPSPLWASGLHLKLESPGALDSFKLEVKLLLDKVDSARDSMGYALDAASTFLNLPVFEFIAEHILSTSVGTINRNELEQLILLTDLEPLAGSMGSAIYPDGFLLERPCLKSNGGCGHRNHRKINVRRSQLVRFNRLSEHQQQFMSRRSAHNDPATVRNYQSQVRPEISRLIDLGKGYYLRLRVPTIAQYRRIAGAWMARLTGSAKQMFVSNAQQEDRQNFMDSQANIALIMAFAHWVEAIEFHPELGGDVEVVVSRTIEGNDPAKQFEADESVDKELIDLSADGGQTRVIVEKIKKFIDDMTLSVFVAPKTKCAGCGKSVTGDDLSLHPDVVQLNAVELFFTLLRHKIQHSGK